MTRSPRRVRDLPWRAACTAARTAAWTVRRPWRLCGGGWSGPVRRARRKAGAAGGGGALGRAGRGRLAPAEGGLRAVQRQVLRSFATTGRAPTASGLAETAARYGTTAGEVLAGLHAGDFVQLGPGGGIRAAYPFSAAPTPHVVRIAGGPRGPAT